MGRVYAVVSAKGGVGKTTTAANLAAALAAAGSRVAVVDGDLGMANLASALGVDIGDVTLHDVLADDGEERSGSDDSASDVAAAIHEGPHGLSVVPGSPALDAFSRADPERLDGVLAELAADHDYVILDTGAGLSNDTVAPLTYVDEILLVSTPTRDALGDTDKTRQVAERLGATVAGAALLQADASAAESDVVVETLDVGVLGTIPDSEEVRRAADAGEPLTTFAPNSPAAAAFASLAAAVTGEHIAVPTASDAERSDEPPESPGDGSDETGEDSDEGDTATDAGAPDLSADPAGVPAADEEPGGRESSADADQEAPVDADQESTADADQEAPIDTGSTDGESDEAVDEERPTETDEEGEPDDEPLADEELVDETDDEEPVDETDDEVPADETDEETLVDETDEATPPDGDDDTDSVSEVVGAEQAVEADADAPDSPVEPADPGAVATEDDTGDADDTGVYATPLEEVPIDEAETEPDTGPDTLDDTESGNEADSDEADPDADTDGTESIAADASDGAESDSDDAADSDEDDDDSGGGFFSRFFG